VLTYRIVIDRSLCSGFGACADLAPDLVELGPDGIAAARVGRSDDPRVLGLAATCPMAAIAIIDAASGERAA
jgi:ferredoxin